MPIQKSKSTSNASSFRALASPGDSAHRRSFGSGRARRRQSQSSLSPESSPASEPHYQPDAGQSKGDEQSQESAQQRNNVSPADNPAESLPTITHKDSQAAPSTLVYFWSKLFGTMAHLVPCAQECLHWPLFFHYVGVMIIGWIAGYLRVSLPFVVFCGALYLKEVDRVQKKWTKMRMRRELEEGLARAKPYTDTESMEWFNALVDKMWGSWLEHMLSKSIAEGLHANLDFYKPQALSKLMIARLRLGSSPPVIKSAKVYRVHEKAVHPSTIEAEDRRPEQEVILELDISYVADEEMSIEFIAKMVGITGRLVGNNLAVEGKLRLGLKFVPYYPYVGFLKVSFTGPPKLHLSLRPLSNRSVDVLDLPGIASWVQRTLRECIAQTMVEPQQLELDLMKLLGTDYGGVADAKVAFQFMPDGHIKVAKHAEVAFAVVEILEAEDLEPKDVHSTLDAYVKMQMGKIKFVTAVKKRGMALRWNELFRLRITSWATSNVVRIRAKDKVLLDKDVTLGFCCIDLAKFRDGNRHEFWLKLEGCQGGKLRVAVTVVEPQRPSVAVSSTVTPSDSVTPGAASFAPGRVIEVDSAPEAHRLIVSPQMPAGSLPATPDDSPKSSADGSSFGGWSPSSNMPGAAVPRLTAMERRQLLFLGSNGVGGASFPRTGLVGFSSATPEGSGMAKANKDLPAGNGAKETSSCNDAAGVDTGSQGKRKHRFLPWRNQELKAQLTHSTSMPHGHASRVPSFDGPLQSRSSDNLLPSLLQHGLASLTEAQPKVAAITESGDSSGGAFPMKSAGMLGIISEDKGPKMVTSVHSRVSGNEAAARATSVASEGEVTLSTFQAREQSSEAGANRAPNVNLGLAGMSSSIIFTGPTGVASSSQKHFSRSQSSISSTFNNQSMPTYPLNQSNTKDERPSSHIGKAPGPRRLDMVDRVNRRRSLSPPAKKAAKWREILFEPTYLAARAHIQALHLEVTEANQSKWRDSKPLPPKDTGSRRNQIRPWPGADI